MGEDKHSEIVAAKFFQLLKIHVGDDDMISHDGDELRRHTTTTTPGPGEGGAEPGEGGAPPVPEDDPLAAHISRSTGVLPAVPPFNLPPSVPPPPPATSKDAPPPKGGERAQVLLGGGF